MGILKKKRVKMSYFKSKDFIVSDCHKKIEVMITALDSLNDLLKSDCEHESLIAVLLTKICHDFMADTAPKLAIIAMEEADNFGDVKH